MKGIYQVRLFFDCGKDIKIFGKTLFVLKKQLAELPRMFVYNRTFDEVCEDIEVSDMYNKEYCDGWKIAKRNFELIDMSNTTLSTLKLHLPARDYLDFCEKRMLHNRGIIE